MFYQILITFISVTVMLGACSADFSGKSEKFTGKKAAKDCVPTIDVDCDPSLNVVPQPQVDISVGGNGNTDILGGTSAGDTDNVGGSTSGGSDSLGGTISGDSDTITPTPKPLTDAEFGARLINNCASVGSAVLPWASVVSKSVYSFYSAEFSKAWLKSKYPNWMYLDLGGNGHFSASGSSYPATVRMAGVSFSHPPNASYDDSLIKLARNNRYLLSKYYPNPLVHVGDWTAVNIPATVQISADVPQAITKAKKPEIIITFCTKAKN